jgi:hypothetical protein
MNKNMLIGYSGLVGSTLMGQTSFGSLYNSKNISSISDEIHDIVICSAAPAVKWFANKNPELDRSNIQNLIGSLSKINCKKLILISTVDVFKDPNFVDELSVVSKTDLHAYGLHRRELEEAVIQLFVEPLIVRLPGLVGAGLKKNILYDLVNETNLENCNLGSIFQFYPLSRLWHDIELCIKNNLALVHLTSEPLSVLTIVQEVFPSLLCGLSEGNNNAVYDFRTIYGELFSGSDCYQYAKEDALSEIMKYKQSCLDIDGCN